MIARDRLVDVGDPDRSQDNTPFAQPVKEPIDRMAATTHRVLGPSALVAHLGREDGDLASMGVLRRVGFLEQVQEAQPSHCVADESLACIRPRGPAGTTPAGQRPLPGRSLDPSHVDTLAFPQIEKTNQVGLMRRDHAQRATSVSARPRACSRVWKRGYAEGCERICGDSGTTVTNASRNSAAADSQRSRRPSPPARRRRAGAWPDTWRSSRPYATTISTRSASPDSTPLLRLNPGEPPWYGPVCPVVWEGRHREVPPYPDHAQRCCMQHLWAHARRGFVDVLKSLGLNPKKLPANPPAKARRALYALQQIRTLYAIERRIRDKPSDYRHLARQTESVPVLNKLRAWLDDTIETIPPSTPLGKAMGYLHNQWEGLVRFCDDGRYGIDTNPIENAIRPFCVGRRNWLFADTVAGANNASAPALLAD